jgi:hypothetical protein
MRSLHTTKQQKCSRVHIGLPPEDPDDDPFTIMHHHGQTDDSSTTLPWVITEASQIVSQVYDCKGCNEKCKRVEKPLHYDVSGF